MTMISLYSAYTCAKAVFDLKPRIENIGKKRRITPTINLKYPRYSEEKNEAERSGILQIRDQS